MFRIYVHFNYFSSCRNLLAEQDLKDLYMYCINWRKYEQLARDDKRFWDDGIGDGLSELLTLKLGVYLTLELKKPAETEDMKNLEAQETKSADTDINLDIEEMTDTQEQPADTQEQPTDMQEQPTDTQEEPIDTQEELTDTQETTDTQEEPTDTQETRDEPTTGV